MAGKGDTYRPGNKAKADKNFEREIGTCESCPNFKGENSRVGTHCKLERCCK